MLPMCSQIRILAALLIVSPAAAAQSRRPITETDLYAFHWIASPQISPDGAKIVYTLITVNSKHDNYEVALRSFTASADVLQNGQSGPETGNLVFG